MNTGRKTCIFGHRIESNQKRERIDTPNLWPRFLQYLDANHLNLSDFDRNGVVCKKHHMKVVSQELKDFRLQRQSSVGCNSAQEQETAKQEIKNQESSEAQILAQPFAVGSQSSVSTSASTVVNSESSLPPSESSQSESLVSTSATTIVSSQSLVFSSESSQCESVVSTSATTIVSNPNSVPLWESSESQSLVSTSATTIVSTQSSLPLRKSNKTQSLVSTSATTVVSLQSSQKSRISEEYQFTAESQLSSQSTFDDSILSQEVVVLELAGMKSAPRTQNACFVCRSKGERARSRVSIKAVKDLAISMKIFLPLGNRCCPSHLNEDQTKFTPEAKQIIRSRDQSFVLIDNLSHWIEKTTVAGAPRAGFDFNNKAGVNYEVVTGLTEEQFSLILEEVGPEVRDSTNRSKRVALGAFLMLLRTGQTQEYIGYQLNMTQRVTSEAIESVSKCLEEKFTKKWLGVEHLTRDEAVKIHGRKSCNIALNIPNGSLVLGSDGTYIYHEKPKDHHEQRISFSKQKMRNFARFLVISTPDGYTVDIFGPYPAIKNDAECMYEVWRRDDFQRFVGEKVHFLVDRGYPDFEKKLREENETRAVIHMPQLLPKNQKQFTAEQANQSRCVTQHRWTVEAQTGILKQKFKFFMGTIPGRYSEKIPRFLKVAVAIKNAFCQVPFTETENHKDLADRLLQKCRQTTNALLNKLEETGLLRLTTKWKKLEDMDVPEFPMIDLVQIRDYITLGNYQLKEGKLYIREHVANSGEFELLLHENHDSILRVQIHSRFVSSRTHSIWIQYTPLSTDWTGIEGFYCTCKSGERVAGCCSHVAAVIRYLAYDRHVTKENTRSSKRMAYVETEKITKKARSE